MKAFFRLLMCSVALFAFAACSSGDDDPVVDLSQRQYVGDFVVDQNDGTTYMDENVKISIAFNEFTNEAVMTFYQVKFSANMPVRLDMVVSGITYSASSTEIRISGNRIVPYAMGGPFEEYMITDFVGHITDNKITFSMTCGEFPVIFTGKPL